MSKTYLLLYSLASAAGWAYVLAICLKSIAMGTISTLWDEVNPALKIVQTAACLEVIHSLIGIVRSSWVTSLMQVFSRVWTLWACMNIAPPAQTSIFFTLACTSWALVEVPRYLFYGLNLLDTVPYPLFWLRYSLFAVLYPTGITGEVGCMYHAGRFLQDSKLYVWGKPFLDVPNIQISMIENLEVSLLLLIIIVAVTYIPGSPVMYGHMVKTRKKQFQAYKEGKVEKKGK
mmetsp:Transcript_36362/g.37033  ORF Transcript_36362/g.37033 Transcript_36362/m.37033 type:complete len:231 (+) Transcript_36362:114-806(+)